MRRYRISQVLSIQALGKERSDDTLAVMASAALQEWLDWLVGANRPASLTDVSMRRVRALVDQGILTKSPSALAIAQRTGLTLGQARYVSSSLASDAPSGAMRQDVMERLEGALKDAGIDDPDSVDVTSLERDTRFIEVGLPRHAAELAVAAYEAILDSMFDGTTPVDLDQWESPTEKRYGRSHVKLGLRPHVAVKIVQKLRRDGHS